MALELMTAAGPGATSKQLDIRSVGTRMVPFRVSCSNNVDILTVWGSPTNAAVNYYVLGTIAAGGGSLTIDEPVDYIKVVTGAAEVAADVFVMTSR